MERFVFFMERFSVGDGADIRLSASFCKSTAAFSYPTASSGLPSLTPVENMKTDLLFTAGRAMTQGFDPLSSGRTAGFSHNP